MKFKPLYTSIDLLPAVSFSEIGEKQNNEDYIFPNEECLSGEFQTFICCDGVGGAPSGEIASKIACHSMAEYFNHHPNTIHGARFMQTAVAFAREKMIAYENKQPESKGMKTTLTTVSFHPAGATLAWMGDSRIFQVRDGEILYQTWDHSYVNRLVEQGLLTVEETRNHPKRNVITKTLGTAKSERIPELKMISDIQPDDYFLLCTDGLLERITDKHISKWLVKKEEPERIKEKILDHCMGQTHDNFSMILIKIKSANSNQG